MLSTLKIQFAGSKFQGNDIACMKAIIQEGTVDAERGENGLSW